MNLECAFKTDIGKKRDHNEDYFGVYPENGLFFVCDGMGGHAAGNYASHLVANTLLELIKKYPSGGLDNLLVKEPQDVPFPGRRLASMLILINRHLFKLAMMYPKLRGMGTTFTSVFFASGYVNVVNVGDSRVYRFRNSRLTQISQDHSWVEEMLADGEIKKEEVKSFVAKNIITRAIGTMPDLQIDWKASDITEGDIYLLCSDGLSGEIDDSVIERILRENSKDLDWAADKLIDAANEAGGSDNTTVVLVKVKGTIAPKPAIIIDEIRTLSAGQELVSLMDSYNDKNYPPAKAKVPESVEKERQKFYRNLLVKAVFIVIAVLGIAVMIKRPWVKKAPVETAISQGEILIRTYPAEATVSIYSDKGLLDKRTSPADFRMLAEGAHRIEIEKLGYENKTLMVSIYEGKKEIREITLISKITLHLLCDKESGFELSDLIYIDGATRDYLGASLSVRDISRVEGQVLNISRRKPFTIKIGEVSRTISVWDVNDIIRVKLENGNILVLK